jgi:hypothetical protein
MYRIVLFLVIALHQSVFAQGTIEFGVLLDGAHAVPPNSSLTTGLGHLFLDENNHFTGLVDLPFGFSSRATSIDLYESSSASSLGSLRFNLIFWGQRFPDIGNGDRGADDYKLDAQITSVDVAALSSGEWYINASSAAFPSGEARGQITTVPEPSEILLLAFGLVALTIKEVQKNDEQKTTKPGNSATTNI